MQTTFFPAILSFISYKPATDSAPAGYKIIAYASYISNIVLATNPSSINVTYSFASFKISKGANPVLFIEAPSTNV